MNTIRINGLTIEFENGIEVIADGDKVIIRKTVTPLPPLQPHPRLPLVAHAFPVIK